MISEKIIVIGGGPAGLSAALYLARGGLSPLVFAGSPPGGQLMLTSEVENFPGQETILGPKLIEKMRLQVMNFGGKIIDENVIKADFSKKPFKVYTQKPLTSLTNSSDNIIFAQSVLIATGAKALWLGLESEQRLRGKGVSGCAVCDGFFFREKRVAVVGGGDSAMEEALTLTKFAKKVYIIHRRDNFRASKIMQERVFKNPKIEIIWNAKVEEVLGEKKVEGVRLSPTTNSKKKIIPQALLIDGLFVAIGHKPETDIFKDQIDLDERGYVITSERLAWDYFKLKIGKSKVEMEEKNEKWQKLMNKFNFAYRTSTSVEGVFAAGDCVDFKYRQAATASGMGVMAALEVEKWVEKWLNK